MPGAGPLAQRDRHAGHAGASCLRIAMAHADSAPPARAPTTTRPASAVIAALAGRSRGLDPPCDVWLVATGAEERLHTGAPDHLGARARPRRARARGGHRRLEWALSSTRWGATARSGCARRPRRRAGPRARCYEPPGARASRSAGCATRAPGNSDHREFELLGLPGMRVGGAGGEPCRHSPCDRPERLDPASLRAARRLLDAALG